jgi:hypothetical protein
MHPLPDLYPFDCQSQSDIAYYFDFNYADDRDPDERARDVIPLMRAWMTDRRRGSLWMRAFPSGLHLVDSRRELASAPQRVVLNDWRAAVYLACDRAQDLTALLSLPAVEDARVTSDEIVEFLQRTCARQLALRLGEHWLSLAVHTPARPLAGVPRALAVSAAD